MFSYDQVARGLLLRVNKHHINYMHCFAVVAFDGDGGDVFSAELSDHLQQSLGPIVVGAGRSVADLRHL